MRWRGRALRVTDVVKPVRTREIQVPIIDAVANDRPGIFQVNVPNRGAIEGIAPDVVVEGKALVDASGAKLLHVGPLPPKLMHLVLGPRIAKAERELAAFTSGDRDLLLGCLLLDDYRTQSWSRPKRTWRRCWPCPGTSPSGSASRPPPGARWVSTPSRTRRRPPTGRKSLQARGGVPTDRGTGPPGAASSS